VNVSTSRSRQDTCERLRACAIVKGHMWSGVCRDMASVSASALQTRCVKSKPQ
jgi:hypothetical protein